MTIAFNHSLSACACENQTENRRLLPIAEAVRQAWSMAGPVATTETVEISKAAGRILAESISAPHAMPFFDNAAMDGFAVNTNDFVDNGPYRLARCGIIAAGIKEAPTLLSGTCLDILTGAPVPKGANAVVPIESTKAEGGQIVFAERPWPGMHIRTRGQDIAQDAVLVEQGTSITACHIGLLASNGFAKIKVYRRPRVAILSTGNELSPAGRALASGQIYDCNRPMLLAMAESQGLAVTDLGIIQDDETELTAHFNDAAAKFDLIISSGSVSVGRCDFVKQAFSAAGGKLHGWKVAIKPGKPVAYGQIGKAVFLGLPGNPYAAWIGMTLLGKTVIQRLLGLPLRMPEVTVAVAGSYFSHKPGRAEYVPVWTVFEDGLLKLHRIGAGGSGSLFPLSMAPGLAVIGASQGNIAEGDALEFLELDGSRAL